MKFVNGILVYVYAKAHGNVRSTVPGAENKRRLEERLLLRVRLRLGVRDV